MDFKTSHKANRLLCVLILTDFVFISLHILSAHTDWLEASRNLRISQEGGYAEYFQYVKEFSIALLLGLVAIKKRSHLYLTWSLLFAYLLLDDSFELHEKVGGYLIGNLIPEFSVFGISFTGKLNYHLGEVIFAGLSGVLVLTLMVFLYRFSNEEVRSASRYLLAMLFLFMVFAVAFDFIVNVFDRSTLTPVIPAIPIVEDGGEHIVMSFILWFSYILHER